MPASIHSVNTNQFFDLTMFVIAIVLIDIPDRVPDLDIVTVNSLSNSNFSAVAPAQGLWCDQSIQRLSLVVDYTEKC